MGCEQSLSPALPCEYPASGYNYQGLEEYLDMDTGNFHVKSEPKHSWRWTANDSTPSSTSFYVFPFISHKLSLIGLHISFKLTVESMAADAGPMIIQLEHCRYDSKTTSVTELATVKENCFHHQVSLNLNSDHEMMASVKKGDIFRLQCINISSGMTIDISHFLAELTSAAGRYSTVRLPFEEFFEDLLVGRHHMGRHNLIIRSYRVWDLLPFAGPIGWTTSPPLMMRPYSIVGFMEIQLLVNVLTPEQQKQNQKRGSLTRKQRVPFKIEFSLSLIRGDELIYSQPIVSAPQFIGKGVHTVEFHITEDTYPPLLRLFHVCDRYQIDRITQQDHADIVRITKFQMKFTSDVDQSRAICEKPHRVCRLPVLRRYNGEAISLDDVMIDTYERNQKAKLNQSHESMYNGEDDCDESVNYDDFEVFQYGFPHTSNAPDQPEFHEADRIDLIRRTRRVERGWSRWED